MENTEKIIDKDSIYEIDLISREIRNTSDVPKVIMQYDHDSERLTFRIPRTYEEYDLRDCTKVEINFINQDSATKESNKGVYEVDDLTIDPLDNSKLIFSWLIADESTQKSGALLFLVRFSKTGESGEIEYAWNTGIYEGLGVQKGMWNTPSVVSDNVDALEKMRAELLKAVEDSTPKRGEDYWTDEDIAEIKSYVDEAILGGAW